MDEDEPAQDQVMGDAEAMFSPVFESPAIDALPFSDIEYLE